MESNLIITVGVLLSLILTFVVLVFWESKQFWGKPKMKRRRKRRKRFIPKFLRNPEYE